MRGAGQTQDLTSDRKEQFSKGSSSAGAAALGSSAVLRTHEGDVLPQWDSVRARLGQRDVSCFQSHFGEISPRNSFFPPEYRWGWKGAVLLVGGRGRCCFPWEDGEEGSVFDPRGFDCCGGDASPHRGGATPSHEVATCSAAHPPAPRGEAATEDPSSHTTAAANDVPTTDCAHSSTQAIAGSKAGSRSASAYSGSAHHSWKRGRGSLNMRQHPGNLHKTKDKGNWAEKTMSEYLQTFTLEGFSKQSLCRERNTSCKSIYSQKQNSSPNIPFISCFM